MKKVKIIIPRGIKVEILDEEESDYEYTVKKKVLKRELILNDVDSKFIEDYKEIGIFNIFNLFKFFRK